MSSCDVQMLRGKDGEFVIKEFCVFMMSPNSEIHAVASFLPPYNLDQLPDHIARQNNFVTSRIHGLKWDDGLIPYTDHKQLIVEMTQGFDKLHVKGHEKMLLIQKWTPHCKVINVEELGCPPFKHLPVLWAQCNFDVHASKPSLTCAARNAKRIAMWVQFHRASS